MTFVCCDDRRRAAVREHASLNGIDFLEVLDREAPPGVPRQRTLLVRSLKPLPPLTAENVRLTGGSRITPVRVLWAHPAGAIPASSGVPAAERAFFAGLPDADRVLVVRTDSSGDFSLYRLALVRGEDSTSPPDGFDVPLSALDFSFKVECPSDFDCRDVRACPPDVPAEPEISYLARDYASFRRLILDRLAQLVPSWREESPADLGITLVELLAYVGDHLSYQQDVIATEAYLGTARRRTSVRRHARLVDYAMHDGCNARVWVQIAVDADLRRAGPGQPSPVPAGTTLLTRVPGIPPRIAPDTPELRRGAAARPELFETMHDAEALLVAHGEMSFYTWGALECCLPRGATSATLRGRFPDLRRGEVLIFEEVRGPRNGRPSDADPTHRHAVRLTRVAEGADPVGGRFDDPASDAAVDVTEIEWAREDALPFPLCISARTDASEGGVLVQDVSVARGNVVLADHGRTVRDEPLGAVPPATLFRVSARPAGYCQERELRPTPSRFRPHLDEGPLTHTGRVPAGTDATGQGRMRPFDPEAPAASALRWRMADVLPAVSLNDGEWQPRRDLLSSDRFDRGFVAEVEDDGRAALRFGDGQLGARPEPGAAFAATYRVGNGTRGNVGADAIGHVVSSDPNVIGVRNPLPAQGGTDPESIEDVRQRAPFAFRTQERAVTPDDYAAAAERQPEVQRAAGTFRWTGSWRTAFVSVDRLGGGPVDESLRSRVRRQLERYRMAGYDLEVDAPRLVPLEVEMQACAEPDYFRSDVKAALLDVFSSGTRSDGQRGVFHPDNFTFGQTVYLSTLYAAAQAVPGVASVRITSFGRQGSPSQEALRAGKLELGRLEIARLDNDPSFPERGVFRVQVEGGK